MDRTSFKWIIFLAIFIGITACGYKGPPLPPKDEPQTQKAIQDSAPIIGENPRLQNQNLYKYLI